LIGNGAGETRTRQFPFQDYASEKLALARRPIRDPGNVDEAPGDTKVDDYFRQTLGPRIAHNRSNS